MAGRKLPEVKAEPILSWWTPGGLGSDAASQGAAPPARSPARPSSAPCQAPWPAGSPVVVHEHVDNVLEQVGLLGGEEAAAQLLDDLAQLRDPVIVLLGVVPAGKSRGQRPGEGVLALPPERIPEALRPRARLLPPSPQLPLIPSPEALSLLCSVFHHLLWG